MGRVVRRGEVFGIPQGLMPLSYCGISMHGLRPVPGSVGCVPCFLYDGCDGFPANAPPLAIWRVQPNGKWLDALARVARTTTTRDVFASNDSRVIYDVFPSGKISGPILRQSKKHTAINARPIALKDLLRWPIRDIPAVLDGGWDYIRGPLWQIDPLLKPAIPHADVKD